MTRNALPLIVMKKIMAFLNIMMLKKKWSNNYA